MKYGKIFLGNGVEFLTGTQMKSTRGGDGYGYGYGPNWSDCCTCCYRRGTNIGTEDVHWTEPEMGRFCGKAGEDNCLGFIDETYDVFNCVNGSEPSSSCT